MKEEKTWSNKYGILGNRYVLEKELGSGASSTVYKVKDIWNNNKEYALKLFNKNEEEFINEIKKEIRINKKISEANSPFFIKYITSSVGYLIKEETKELKSYIIFELGSKGSVINFIINKKEGLDEKNCKLIFAKILLIVKTLHRLGICHRDLKLDNILFGDNYQLKLCDFGFSVIIPKDKNGKAKKIKGQYGTPQFTAPEIHKNIPYNGEKVDIFSLGVILFNLRTCKFGFTSTKDNDLYDYIKKKNIPGYWSKLKTFLNLEGLSEEFKNLFIKMVAYNPKERPTIEEIYNDEWMKEIKDLNEEEFEKYELDLIKELRAIEDINNSQIEYIIVTHNIGTLGLLFNNLTVYKYVDI